MPNLKSHLLEILFLAIVLINLQTANAVDDTSPTESIVGLTPQFVLNNSLSRTGQQSEPGDCWRIPMPHMSQKDCDNRNNFTIDPSDSDLRTAHLLSVPVQASDLSGSLSAEDAVNIIEPTLGLVGATVEGEGRRCSPSEIEANLLNNLSEEIDIESDPRCQRPDRCSEAVTKPMAKDNPKRTALDKYIIEAANETGVHPALIKAQLHAETGIDPLAENKGEKEADANGTLTGWAAEYRWGKGLGQFGANNAADHGLDWHADKPTEEQLKDPDYLETLNTPYEKDGKILYSIWSPKGGVLAKANMLKELQEKEATINLRDENGEKTGESVRVDTLYKRTKIEEARYLAGMYNRGNMPINSIEEHYRQNGTFPRWYGVAWDTSRNETTPTYSSGFSILKGERINRCHVFKIAGLCGDESQGWFGEYSNDYEMYENGEWNAIS